MKHARSKKIESAPIVTLLVVGFSLNLYGCSLKFNAEDATSTGTITTTDDPGESDSGDDSTVAWADSYSVYCDGASDQVASDDTLEDILGGGTIQQFSYSLWVKSSAGAVTDETIVSSTTDDLSTPDGFGLFWFDATGFYHQQKNYGGGGKWTETVTSTDWNHLIVTYDGSLSPANTRLNFYVNGTHSDTKGAVSVGTSFEPPSGDGAKFKLCALGTSSSYDFKGYINDVGVWNVVLDSNNVTAIYNSGAPFDISSDSGNYSNSTNLKLYWVLGDMNDSGTTVYDQSGNNRDGELRDGANFQAVSP